jgi:antitoxin ParD1/3/4
MAYPFSPSVQGIVEQYMATGGYASEDELLLDAFAALRQRDEDLAAIQAGIADMEAGRVRPLDDVFADLRRDFGLSVES